MDFDLSVRIGKIELKTPVIIASGVWPYEEEFWREERLHGVGAVCTKAISLNNRAGNSGTRLWETPAGMLNSIGLQNIGVGSFIEKYHSMLINCGCPVIANVVMESEAETAETLMRLRDSGCISAVELNISCPNVDGDGMAWGISEHGAAAAARLARKSWDGPLWVKMTPQAPYPAGVARAIESEGADALVVANTWLGMAMDITKAKPAFVRTVAGLSGPAVFPLALRLVWDVCGAVSIPVIGCGGVTTSADCAAMMLAGAYAVEAGTAFFRNINAGRKICDGLPVMLGQYGIAKISEITGMAR